MNQEKHLILLRAIQDLALLPYPYPKENPPVDSSLILALGQIAGIAMKAISDATGAPVAPRTSPLVPQKKSPEGASQTPGLKSAARPTP
jgi:hypothetical protein